MIPSDNLRSELIARHLWLILPVARQVYPRARPRVEFDDLLGDGALGLVRAADRFQPHRGVPFARFAVRYIRGAMLDSIRSAWKCSGRDVPFASLDFNGESLVTEDPAPGMDDMLDAIALLELLPPRWKLLIQLYYLESLTLKRAGNVLGVTEARASQLLRKSLERLRAASLDGRKKQPRGRRARGVLHFSPHANDHR